MKLYTDDAGETLNRREQTFYAWRKPSKGDKEINVMKSQIIEEVYENETNGEGYLLRPGNYNFKNQEVAE
ncbi:hypothetical protein RBI89_07495 [Bacillus subtilis]|uniref:hypothetical protein n=1 Tax=Bacillus subtilis TaxID=1423 RepID=UPI0027E11438|nr:hypothetical protein [Bacillus subtilis]MDQ4709391.1 hypothetical protein [Bacillus subtilis]